MKCIRLLIITVLIFYLIQNTFAQKIIKGKVSDEQNNPLFLCLIYTEHAHTYTNENGIFEIKIQPDDNYLKFYYLGFIKDSVPVNTEFSFIEIKLKSNFISLNEITVVSSKIKNSYALLYESMIRINQINKIVPAKAYFELITYEVKNKDTLPVENFRAFYNVTLSPQGFSDPEIYAGRFILPEKNHFMNFASIHLLKKFHLTEDPRVFPHQPYYCESKQHLKNLYKLHIDEVTYSDNDTLVKIFFTPFEKGPDSVHYFKGDVMYNLSKKQIERLSLFNKGFKRHRFVSINNPKSDTIRLTQTEMQILFKDNRIDFINCRMALDFYTLNSWRHYVTVMKFNVIKKHALFFLPIFPDYYENITDYHKLYIMPYNEKVFEKYNLMKPSSESENVLNLFKNIKCIDSKNKIKILDKLNQDFQVIGNQNNFSFYQFKHKNTYNKNLPVTTKNLSARDSIFLFSFPIININEEDKNIIITPVMDIKNSFIVNENKFIHVDNYIRAINRLIDDKQNLLNFESVLNGETDLKKFYKELEDEYYRTVTFLNHKFNWVSGK
jgi:hypothetical protein